MQTMATPNEAATFAHRKGAYGCFPVPKKKDQWIYGYLTHNIGYGLEDDCGVFFMEDGLMETFPLRIVDAATLRLVKGDKSFSACHLGFDAAKERIWTLDYNFRQSHPDTWQQLKEQLRAESLRKFRFITPLKPAPVPKPPKPQPPKSVFPIKTPVAARSGSRAPFPELETPTTCGWWAGYVLRFEPKNTYNPYIIRFATKPTAVNVRVSEPKLKKLVWNYKYCDDFCIFKGIVGRELLWPSPGPRNNAILRYTKVLELNRTTKMFKLGFRDGLTFELSGPQLDRASVVEEHILAESEVSIDVDGDEPKLVVFKASHIQEAKFEMGRYKTTGPDMATPSQFGSDFSADTESSGEDTSSSTASVHLEAVTNKKSRGSLGGRKIKGTPDETTDRPSAKIQVCSNASLRNDVQGKIYVHTP
jgi:hypothetical protein